MRTSAAFLAVLLAVATASNAFARGRHHHHHHHHVAAAAYVPSEYDMKWLALAGTASLFLPIPFTILATHTADEAGQIGHEGGRRHHR